MSLLFRKFFVCVSLFALVCFAYAQNPEYESIEKNLKHYEQKLTALQESIDNSVFSDEEILLKSDFDADKLIAFTQDKIVFQPYVGLLRGVQGTLNSRSGNALDQAVLLAKLLGDAGLETRIGNGTLSEELTKQLLSNLANAEIPSHIGQGEEFEKALAAFTQTKTKSQQLDWTKSETYKRYQSTLGTLQQVLKENNIRLEKIDVTKKLIQENKDYFWVEYRLSANDGWKSAHPAFVKGMKVDVEAMSYFKESVPKKYLHQVRVEAFIQQRIGRNYKTHGLMKAWQIPAANLHNVLITYSNAPSGVNIKSKYNLEKILKDSNYFIPTFNGNAVGGRVFDLKGRLIDTEAMNSPAGAFFQTMGDKALLAVKAVEDNKDGKDKLQLTAQWLQFTFIQPDGSEYVQKRYLYQANENEKVNEKKVKLSLMSEYSLLASTGDQPISYLAKVYIDMVQDGLPLLKASTRKLFHGEEKTAFPKELKQSEFELLTQYYWMNHNPDRNKQTVHYRATTNMLGFKRGLHSFKEAFIAVDIISNKQRFIYKQSDKYFNDLSSSFSHGIWETASEWLPAKMLSIFGDEIDTLKVTAVAKKQNINMQVTQDKTKVQQIFANDVISLKRVLADINLGYLVVLPSQQPQDLKMTGWWRINPITGETLGMTSDGGGQSLTEYAIEHAQVALMLARSLHNLQKCDNDDSLNNYEKMCCMAEAHLNNVIGLSFGGVLGKAVGTAGAAVFDIVDFTSELATGTGIAPSTNGAICEAVGPIPDF